ncbi:MAG: molecular chaperone Skp [Enterobacteriaceae bacterium]
MKKLLCAATLGLALAASNAAIAAPEKIAVVNIASIFQQLPQREAIAKQLEGEFKGRAEELQKMEKSLQGKIQRLQRDAKTMKESERTKMEKDVMADREKFATKAKAFEEDNQKRHMEERNKLVKRIQDAVQSVAKKEGYTLVLDMSSVAYADPTKEITSEVLKQVK